MSDNHPPGSTYPHPPPQHYSSAGTSRYIAAAIVIVSVLFVVALVRLAGFILRSRKEEQEENGRRGLGGAGDTTGAGSGAGAVRVVHQPPLVAVEVQAGPVVCAYRRSDGWREATCPVCLSDFADGEVVRVLPACMHYFHAACVDVWLRANTTCPLCRAAPPLPSPAGSPAKAAAASTA